MLVVLHGVEGVLGSRREGSPSLGLGVTFELFEHGRVGAEERGAVGVGALRVELRDLELSEREVRRALVEACT